MATRMQQRRGTASQWVSSNDGDGPTLNAGEIGFETDTNKFKIGDGVSAWVDLAYFNDAEGSGGASLEDYIPLTQKGAANGVAGLDGNGKLASAQIPNLDEITQDILDTALVAGTGLDKTYNDNAGTYTMDIDSTVATLTGTQTFTNKTLTSPKINEDVVLSATATELNILDGATLSTTELNYVDGVTSSIQTQLNTLDTDKADLASPTFTGTVTTDDLVVGGDFTVNGTNFAASATSITIEDNMIQIAHNNPANTVDLGLVVAYNDGTAKHAGLVKDTSANTWKLFKGVTTEPATTVDFTQGSLDDLSVNVLSAASVTLGDGSTLGTPTSLTLTNATGLPVSTGISGLGTDVATFLATPSSANFASMISDEIGTGNVILSELATNNQTASYTLALADKAKVVEMAVGSANNLTVPTNASVAYPVGTQIHIVQVGSGQTTVVASGGVTINTATTLKLRAQWSAATLIKRAENTWVLAGDLATS